MRERPIIFTAPMVKAILDGRKTQTRRVLKPQPPPNFPFLGIYSPYLTAVWGREIPDGDDFSLRLPIVPKDVLWVREAWAIAPSHAISPDPDRAVVYRTEDSRTDYGGPWRSPSHMPRWASRITLRVTDVRVQRLQDITEADAIAEGATSRPKCFGFSNAYDGWSMDWSKVGTLDRFAFGASLDTPGALTESDLSLSSAKWAFASYWDDLHGDGSWDGNPWVAAISFERLL